MSEGADSSAPATPQAPPKDLFPNEFSMNCPINAVLSGGVGGALGGVLGGVLGTYSGLTDPDFSGPYRARFRHAAVLGRGRAWSFMKGFGVFSLLYEASLCTIEKARAKTELINHVYAGCLTGGAMGAHAGGISGACFGCAGMAAFSFVIETFLHSDH
eukprot:c1074_g1_i1.p1 GENE.c1074_g1_i1~~c1074_g1_i1.p1  ORF type:complete len:169 (+),score=24.26 c1074_g1_i1:36-509(+)